MIDFVPHDYQQYCIDWIVQNPYCGVFLDMGMGKTAITLSAINELKFNRWAVGRVLIIAPKKVAEATWRKEAAKWKQLKHLTFSEVLGTAAQRIRALNTPADIYVINRENTQWLVDYYRHSWPFDTVIIDESSSFKNPQAKRFKALKLIRSRTNRIVLLTGTPSPHGLLDLWSQIYLLDEGKRLGRTLTVYRDLYFVPDKRGRDMIYSYTLREGAAEAIQEAISDICISMKAEDYLTLPPILYEDIPVVLDAPAQKAYTRLERDLLLPVSEDTVITAGSAAVLSGKLLQLCNGAVYDEDGLVNEIHNCKIEAFMETVEQLHGQSAVVYYNFQHDLTRLLAALSKTKLRVRVYRGAQDEDDWNAGKIDILLAQPQSCSYGLNLQEGGWHEIWFGLIQSLEQYQQANRRLYRQGQTHPVIVHHLIVQGGRDEDVIKSLNSYADVQDSLIESLCVRIRRVREEVAAA